MHNSNVKGSFMADARSQARRWGVFNYEEQQKAQEKKTQPGGGSSYSSNIVFPEGVKPFRFPEDKSFVTLDIIPFLTDHFGETTCRSEVSYFRHNNIGAPHPHNYICPKKTVGLPCPICDAMYKLDFNDPDDRAIRWNHRPKERRLYVVRWIDGPEETRDDLFILDQSPFMFGDLISRKLAVRDMADPEEVKWGSFPDLMEGYSLKVGLSTESFNGRKYIKPVSIDFKKRNYTYASTPEEEDDFLSTVPDLYKCLRILPYDELNTFFQTGKLSQEVEMNTSPTQQESHNHLDPTLGHSPIVSAPVLHNVPIFTSQKTGGFVDEVEGDVPF